MNVHRVEPGTKDGGCHALLVEFGNGGDDWHIQGLNAFALCKIGAAQSGEKPGQRLGWAEMSPHFQEQRVDDTALFDGWLSNAATTGLPWLNA